MLLRVRNGWRGQWQRGQLHQQQHVVIGGRAVHPQPPAARAAVNQHPPAFAADGDRDRLHAARAVSLPVTGNVAVKMPGPQAAGTVVAVRRAGRVQGDVYAAMSALKRARKRQVWRPSFRAGPRSWADISPPLVLMPLARPGRQRPPSSAAANHPSSKYPRLKDAGEGDGSAPLGVAEAMRVPSVWPSSRPNGPATVPMMQTRPSPSTSTRSGPAAGAVSPANVSSRSTASPTRRVSPQHSCTQSQAQTGTSTMSKEYGRPPWRGRAAAKDAGDHDARAGSDDFTRATSK
jgi:hypothetical protein